MVNNALSATVWIVAVNQLLINILVDKEDTIKLFASPARNNQSATARLFLLFLYGIDSMFVLFVRSIAKPD